MLQNCLFIRCIFLQKSLQAANGRPVCQRTSVFIKQKQRFFDRLINFHALRYTFATRALDAGMDIKVLSSILGHAQASTTLNLYAHALPDHKKRSMEKMDSFYGSTLGPT